MRSVYTWEFKPYNTGQTRNIEFSDSPNYDKNSPNYDKKNDKIE